MSTSPTVSLAQVREELQEAQGIIRKQSWHLDTRDLEPSLRLRAYVASPVDQEIYLFEFDFTDYPAAPPQIDMIDLRSGGRNVPAAFPRSTDSLFHPGNLICIQFNRGAYKTHGGPHGDWTMANWQAALPGVTGVGDMLSLLWGRLVPDKYQGRKR